MPQSGPRAHALDPRVPAAQAGPGGTASGSGRGEAHADGPMATLRRDGTRRWIHPTVARGRYHRARAIVAGILVATYLGLPHLSLSSKPAVLLDLSSRQFTFLGKTLFATDTAWLAAFLVFGVVSVALLTALLGRVWCGWACPQTIYMEFVFRPIEALFEGPAASRRRRATLGRTPRGSARWLAKWLSFAVIAAVLSAAFVSYFAGPAAVVRALRSPGSSSTIGIAFAAVALLVLLDFGWMREQVCIFACPYGRIQAALTDASSLIVGYDGRRGEPRGPRGSLNPSGPEGAVRPGDCVDCFACVRACPTGIDIRNGLQLECVGCTQCIDACDAIMTRLRRPTGLIRYTSLDALQGRSTRLFRPRVLVYLAVILGAASVIAIMLIGRASFEVDMVRRAGAPFTVRTDGIVTNSIRLRITNRLDRSQMFQIGLTGPEGSSIVVTDKSIELDARSVVAIEGQVLVPGPAFKRGRAPTTVSVTSSGGSAWQQDLIVLGPEGTVR
jgi:cytochrome c oxidase accessory protein FixG